MRISVALIAQDEEDRLAECLRSITFADEVVLVDSGSRDGTVELAKSHGCNVLEHPWMGFSRQKQFAVDHCRNDWVFILDADERIPSTTSDGILKIMTHQSDLPAAFSLLRRNWFHGRWIRHCGWWPDRIVRLVNRRHGRFSGDLVHEKWLPDGSVADLDYHFDHYSFRNYADLIQKMQNYSNLAARDMRLNGRSASWFSPISHGFWMFLKTYFFRLGVMDGFDGFVISLLNAGGSFMKYAKLMECEKIPKDAP
jgi:glycosyltransferase involved in cell wall biosynthesis